MGGGEEKKIYVAGFQSKNGTQDSLNMKPNRRHQKFIISLCMNFTCCGGIPVVVILNLGLARA
jgi:hypothetical protein